MLKFIGFHSIDVISGEQGEMKCVNVWVWYHLKTSHLHNPQARSRSLTPISSLHHRVPFTSKQSPIKYSSFKYFKSSRVLHAATHISSHYLAFISHQLPLPTPDSHFHLLYFIHSLQSPCIQAIRNCRRTKRGTHTFSIFLWKRDTPRNAPVENMYEMWTLCGLLMHMRTK